MEVELGKLISPQKQRVVHQSRALTPGSVAAGPTVDMQGTFFLQVFNT